MKRKVLHQHVYRKNVFGGETLTTLCGRVRNGQGDYNMADTPEQVTCKFCIPLLKRGV